MQVFEPACAGGRGLLASAAMPEAEMGYFIKEGKVVRHFHCSMEPRALSLTNGNSLGCFTSYMAQTFGYSIIGQQVKIARDPFAYVYPTRNAHLYDQGKE
ncbi:hypothetical protein AMTR_s00062p00132510 [Amborella trichopoda]|uniref:Uncharacterized protein n=1 Tax=Amborella trichopoda TaxID=13333 RepID=U5DAS2_AMBTC|nr:hypothetical protein AMTR_s00062p00132510 [Amborella trichopoda]